MQFFKAGVKLTCDPRPLFVLEEPHRAMLDQPGAKQLLTRLVQQGQLSDSDLDSTIFNFLLPRGAVLRLDQDDSRHGLAGFHDSVHFQHKGQERTAYYSANVFSEFLPNGLANGIPAFDASWKDVVGTLYHEMNEFRTDADVGDAIEQNNDNFLGWMGAQGEIGDQPINAAGEAGNLSLVFQEILLSMGGGRVPVQFLYSNAVHGAEGPIDQADPPHKKLTSDAISVLSNRRQLGRARTGIRWSVVKGHSLVRHRPRKTARVCVRNEAGRRSRGTDSASGNHRISRPVAVLQQSPPLAPFLQGGFAVDRTACVDRGEVASTSR